MWCKFTRVTQKLLRGMPGGLVDLGGTYFWLAIYIIKMIIVLLSETISLQICQHQRMVLALPWRVLSIDFSQVNPIRIIGLCFKVVFKMKQGDESLTQDVSYITHSPWRIMIKSGVCHRQIRQYSEKVSGPWQTPEGFCCKG